MRRIRAQKLECEDNLPPDYVVKLASATVTQCVHNGSRLNSSRPKYRGVPVAVLSNEVLVGLAVFGSACLSLVSTPLPGGVALFWPGSAIAGALLIRLRHVRWNVALVSILVAFVLSNVVMAHRPWPIAGLVAAVNVFEVALMVAIFRFAWVLPYPKLSITDAGLMAAVFGILIPGCAAVAGGLLMHAQYATPFVEATLQWWSSHAIGACLLGPPIILFSSQGLARLLRTQFVVQNVLALMVCVVGCYLAISYLRFPFVLIGALLFSAASRMGGLGAAGSGLCVALVIYGLWIIGIRPLGLDPAAAASGSWAGFPVIALLATVMPPVAVGLGSDARRAAVRALRVSERRFRDSMKHSPIGMLISNLDGTWGYTNIALQEMLGYTEQEFSSMPPGGPSSAEEWSESTARWQRLVAGEIDYYDTVRRFHHKDGSWIWTHVAVSLLRDDAGKPLHLIAQIESLKARQGAEESLAAERERFRITLKSISEAVITTDADTRITYINAAAEDLLASTLQSVEHRRIDEVIYLMDPETSKTATSLIAQSLLRGQVCRREHPCLLHRPDGTVCYVTDVVSPVVDSAGLLTGMVIVLHDATLDVARNLDLRHRAMHDSLTGLSNRTDFEQRLRMVFRKAQQLNQSAAVVAIDLDRFKAVNDAGGHAAGDALLCKVAATIRSAVRSSDMVARLGGDEFAVILDNCAPDRAVHIGEKIVKMLNPIAVTWEGSIFIGGASVGLALNAGAPDESAWQQAADAACFSAKREGRGRLATAAAVAADMAPAKQA